MKYPDNKMIGMRFGKLKVQKLDSSNNNMKHFECKCNCGNRIIANKYLLLNGHTKSCGCLMAETVYAKGQNNKHWAGTGEIPARYWWRLKNNAKIRRHKFSITPHQAWELFLSQDRKCMISGVPLVFAQCVAEEETTTASLDRIDSGMGYNINNVQWLHKIINAMKWDLPVARFIELCYFVEHPIVDSKVDLNCKHPKNFAGHGGIGLRFWHQIENLAKARDLQIDITIKDAWDLFLKQEGRCAVTGLPLCLIYSKTTASLDRINNSYGYIYNNIQWVHKDINTRLRRNMSLDDMKKWCAIVNGYQQ